MNLFSELRRRNVFRAAAFYAASAWLLVQVATQVFPFFGMANWLVRWIIVAAAIGFPFGFSSPGSINGHRTVCSASRRLVRCNQKHASLAEASIAGSLQCWPWPWFCC